MKIGSLLMGALLLALGTAFAITRAPAAIATAGTTCDGGSKGACEAPSSAAAHGDVDLPEGKPRLIEFESAHCAVCKRMAPLVKELEARCAKEAGTVLRIQIDDPRGEALAAHYGVRFVPTFIGVDATGQEVERAVGELARERLASLLGDVRGEACPPLL